MPIPGFGKLYLGLTCKLAEQAITFMRRPVDGDVIYTDFYGRCGEDPCNFYGRRYDLQTTEFKQNWLVDDNDYIKVQASMPGAWCQNWIGTVTSPG